MSRLAQAFRRAAAAGTIGSWSMASPALWDEGTGLMAITGAPWESAAAKSWPLALRDAARAAPSVFTPRRPLLEPEAIPREPVAALALRLYEPGSLRDRKRAVLFTAVGREGRSAQVSAAVADVLARSTSGSVCLIDANLRAPTVHRLFGMQPGAGLAGVLLDQCDLRSALVPLGPNISLLPGGTEHATALARFTADVLRKSIHDLLAAFDCLVVDTSAANAYRDAATLGPLVDGTVLVVSANATRRETGRTTVDELERGGAAVVGAVLLDRGYPIPEAVYRRL